MTCKIATLLKQLKKAFPYPEPAIGFLAVEFDSVNIEWTLHADGKCYTFESFKELENHVQKLLETYAFEQVLTFGKLTRIWGEGGESSELEVK